MFKLRGCEDVGEAGSRYMNVGRVLKVAKLSLEALRIGFEKYGIRLGT